MPSGTSKPDQQPDSQGEEVTEHFLIFVVPLPDPLPISHGTTYSTFFPWPIAALDDMPMRPGVDAPPFPEEVTGKQFVSLKFWQVKERVSQADMQAMQSVSKVVDELTGQKRNGETFHIPSDDEGHYRTVVEMVTVAAQPPGGKPFFYEGVDQSDPFDRCFAYLQRIFRAYRLSEGVRVPELTYQRLLPYVMVLQRDLHEASSPPAVTWMMLLNQMNINDVPAPTPLTGPRQERMNTFLALLLQGNPFALFAERSLEARKAVDRDGNYGNAIVQCALSTEVLLDGLLGVMLWEESLAASDPQAAAKVLSRPFTSKVKQEFHPRLGGYWGLDRPGAFQDWEKKIAYPRGRVVHRGYRPTEAEARQALEAANKLEIFVKARLAHNAARYSRTALMLMGRPGLERHCAWKKVEHFVEEKADIEPPWSLSYSTWRDAVDLLVSV